MTIIAIPEDERAQECIKRSFTESADLREAIVVGLRSNGALCIYTSTIDPHRALGMLVQAMDCLMHPTGADEP